MDRLAFPALAGWLPTVHRHRALDRTHHIAAQAQAEQIGLVALFGLAHRRLAGPGIVAAQQPRLPARAQTVQQPPQVGRAVLRRVLVAGTYFHLQHQPQRANHEAVVGVTGAARLGGIVADNGPFLVPIQRLHRGVGVQDQGSPSSGRVV